MLDILQNSQEMLHVIPGVYGSEWLILIVIVVLLIFGAKKIPELARSLGRASGEFQKARLEVEKEFKTIEGEKKEGDLKPAAEAKNATLPADKDKLLKIAKELGIETEGKTESEIREEISKAMMR